MKYLILCLSLLLALSGSDAQPLTSKQILQKSIEHHDPNNSWQTFEGKFYLDEIRKTTTRDTRFTINNNVGQFLFERDSTRHGMLMDSCFVTSGNADCERVATIRNYYLYLWGLPMKLADEGTNLKEDVNSIDLNGQTVYQIEVHYERENWSYFIDENTFALVGYQFYFNLKEGGELVLLEQEISHEGIRFPKERIWYEMPGKKYLAKDILKRIE